MNMFETRRFVLRWRLVPVLALVALLSACNVATIAYNRAPSLIFWRLDAMLDLSGEQSALLRPALQDWHAWHRTAHLPQVADAMRQWQLWAVQDLTAEQVCQVFDQVRVWVAEAGQAMLPALADLAPTLSPSQLERWSQHQAKQTETFAQDFGPPGRVSDARHRRAVERSEMFYGRLSPGQRDWLRLRMEQGVFDVEQAVAERQARHADALETVSRIQAGADAMAEMERAWQRTLASPREAYRRYAQLALTDACSQFAELHNQTTDAQRQRAVQRLQTYERDIRSLVNGR